MPWPGPGRSLLLKFAVARRTQQKEHLQHAPDIAHMLLLLSRGRVRIVIRWAKSQVKPCLIESNDFRKKLYHFCVRLLSSRYTSFICSPPLREGASGRMNLALCRAPFIKWTL